jgi:hypothetical protein
MVALITILTNINDLLTISGFMMHTKKNFNEQLKPHKNSITSLKRLRAGTDYRNGSTIFDFSSCNLIFGDLSDKIGTFNKNTIYLKNSKSKDFFRK